MSILTDQIDADFQAVLEADEFAIDAIWTDGSSVSTAIRGLFNSPYAKIDVNTPVEGGRYSFRCLSSAVTGIQQNDTLTIGSTVYDITGVQPDGVGTVLLILSEHE